MDGLPAEHRLKDAEQLALRVDPPEETHRVSGEVNLRRHLYPDLEVANRSVDRNVHRNWTTSSACDPQPDGKKLLVIAVDGTVRLWETDVLRSAMERKPRELTASEKQRFHIPSR